MKKSNSIYFIVLALSFSCTKNDQPVNEVQSKTEAEVIEISDSQEKSIGLTFTTVKQVPISSSIQVTGSLDVPPQNMVTISAPMGGFVKQTHLLQGMKIKKGESLVTLVNEAYIALQQDYLESISKLELVEATYERQKALNEENINSQKSLQEAKSDYESIKARIQALEAKLELINISPSHVKNNGIQKSINILSPIDGYVTMVNVNLGQFVNPADVMFKLVNLEHLHAELQVFEKDISKIKTGQKVNFQLANESEKRNATVYLIGKEISANRTVRVHCHLDKEDQSLLPGMFVNASIAIDNLSQAALPNSAVLNFEGSTYVFVKSGDHQYRFEPVSTQVQNESFTQITVPDKWNDSTVIVDKGAFELLGLLKNKEEE